MAENFHLRFSSSIENICDVNESFGSGTLRVCYTGANRNGSYISRESIENAIPTMYNCPVVCNYDVQTDEIGGHDVCCIRNDDGELRLVNLTDAVGVIPFGAEHYWEIVNDGDSEHEYFVTSVILWKRSPVYKKIVEDGIVSHSMEITVKNGFMDDDGLFVIRDFIFTAFCLLGEDVEPCFESSSLQLFSRDELSAQFAQMMADFKAEFQMVSPSTEDDNNKNLTEGGNGQLEIKNELLAKYGLSIDQLDLDIESMSVEELEMELQRRTREDDDDAQSTESENAEPNSESEDTPEEDTQESEDGTEEFSLLVNQLIDSLHETLDTVRMTTEWGECGRYYYCDCDIESSEVFCYDLEDWKLYGFTYSMSGDKVTIDFDSKRRKKFAIVDFKDGDAEFSIRPLVEQFASAMNAATKTELQSKYDKAKESISALNVELEKLRQYQQAKNEEERSAAVGAVFAVFNDLVGNEAFESLRSDYGDMSVEDIEEKCFAIRGRAQSKVFSTEKPAKQTRLPIDRRTPGEEPYGGLFVEFPPAGR